MIEAAKRDEQEREKFIRDNEQTILKIASRVTGRYITKSDDEWSVALLSFNKAIDTFEDSRGDFTAYASVVIRRALTDHYRSEKKYSPEIPVSHEMLTGEGEYEENSEVLKAVSRDSAEEQDRLSEASGEAIDREEWNRRSVKEIVKEYDRIKDGGRENKPDGNGTGQYPGSITDGRDDREILQNDQRMIKDDQEGQQGDRNGQQNELDLQTDERDRQMNDPGGKQGDTGIQKNETDGQQWKQPVQQNDQTEQQWNPPVQQNGSQEQPGTPPLQPGDSVKQPDGPAEQPNSGDGYGGQADPNREDGVRTQEGTGQVQEDPGRPQGGSEPSWNEGGAPREDGGLLPDDHSRTRSEDRN